MISRCLAPVAASALLLPLAGCDGEPAAPQAERVETAPVSVSAASGGRSSSAPVQPAPATSAPLPPDAPDHAALEQVEDPARVLAFLATALHDGRWADVVRAWGESGNAQALQQRFGRNGPVTLTFAAGESEGAAGSLYYSAPYALRRADGSEERGTIVLRRVNDVPGASQASLRWHVSSMDAGGPTGS